MSTNSAHATELDAFQCWVSDHGRIPRLSSLDREELFLARWLERVRPEALAGTLDAETYRALSLIPGAVPARKYPSIGEWCARTEGFFMDRGTLPSLDSPDSFESTLARAVNDAVIPVVRTGGSVLKYSGLDACLPELDRHAARLRESPAPRPKPAKPVKAPGEPHPNTAGTRNAVAGSRAREQESHRLAQMRAYVADTGFLPLPGASLSKWAARRIAAGDGPVAGVAIELLEIRRAYPAYNRSGHLRWARKAAAHVRVHGTLPEIGANKKQASMLDLLRLPADDAGTPPGLLADIRTVLSAPPAPSPVEIRRLEEIRRLAELQAYIQEHSHLPSRRTPLGWWSADRILTGSSPAAGVVDELVRLKAGHPDHRKAKTISWVQAAAAHHAEHGVLPPLTLVELRNKQDALRKLIEQYDLPGHLLPVINLVLAEGDPYGKKWSAVFGDFTVWVDAHGALPNRRSTDREEYRLANWLNVQCVNQRAGTLRPDLAERLGTVDGSLTPRARRRLTRQERIAQMMSFHAANGRLPSYGSSDNTERSLGGWLAAQRRGILEGRAAPVDFGELAGVPGALTPAESRRTSIESAAMVADFRASHGHFPRRGSKDAEERRLAVWLLKARAAVRSGKASVSDFGGLAEVPGALEDPAGPRPAG